MKRFLMFGYDEHIVKRIVNENIFIDLVLDPWDLMDYIPKPFSEKEKRIFVNDSTSIEDVVEALKREKIEKYDLVFSRYESTMIISSVISELKSTKPFLYLETSINFRDKFVQKSLVYKDLNVANFQFIKNVDEFKIKELKINFPLIMKPHNGSGTFLTFLVKNVDEFLEKLKVFSKEKKKSIIIEEYIQGDEYQVDGFIYKDELVFLISKYGKPVLNISQGFILNSISLNPHFFAEVYKKLNKIIAKLLHLLKYSKGVFHIEFFKTKDSWVFSECAARIGGGFSNELFMSIYDKSLSDILVDILLEKNKININSISKYYYAFSYIQPLGNKVKKLPTEKFLKTEFPFLKKVLYEWKPGEQLPDTKLNSVRRTGMVLIEGSNIDDINNKIETIYNYFENFSKK